MLFLSALENSSIQYSKKLLGKNKENLNKNYPKKTDIKIPEETNTDNTNNLIQKIFGGNLLSSVICMKCKNCSLRKDKFIDISLVINIQ